MDVKISPTTYISSVSFGNFIKIISISQQLKQQVYQRRKLKQQSILLKNCWISFYLIERVPSQPYIREGFPKNQTVLVNGIATFECPTISDNEPYIQFIKPDPNKKIDIETLDPKEEPKGVILQVFKYTTCRRSVALGWYLCGGSSWTWSPNVYSH